MCGEHIGRLLAIPVCVVRVVPTGVGGIPAVKSGNKYRTHKHAHAHKTYIDKHMHTCIHTDTHFTYIPTYQCMDARTHTIHCIHCHLPANGDILASEVGSAAVRPRGGVGGVTAVKGTVEDNLTFVVIMYCCSTELY